MTVLISPRQAANNCWQRTGDSNSTLCKARIESRAKETTLWNHKIVEKWAIPLRKIHVPVYIYEIIYQFKQKNKDNRRTSIMWSITHRKICKYLGRMYGHFMDSYIHHIYIKPHSSLFTGKLAIVLQIFLKTWCILLTTQWAQGAF